jgi:hypothetical protein
VKLAGDTQALFGGTPSSLLLSFARLARLSFASRGPQRLTRADRVPES